MIPLPQSAAPGLILNSSGPLLSALPLKESHMDSTTILILIVLVILLLGWYGRGRWF